MASNPIKLVICGGGNGAHAMAGISASQANTDVCVLTLFQDEAERWSNSLKKHDYTVNLYRKGELYETLKAKPRLVTKQPEEVIPGCDVIAFVLPAFAHEQYLEAIKPHLEPGMILVGLPGQSGFDFQERAILGNIAKQIILVNFETLPWATRIIEFGKNCEVLGTKDAMMGSVQVGSATPRRDPYKVVQKLIGEKPTLITKGHPLASNLMSANAYAHTSILYGEWSDWDGTPLDQRPLFYHGLSEKSAALLSSLSDEVVQTAKAIQAQSPDTDMSEVVHLHTFFKRCYPDNVGDQSSLLSCIRTNAAYKGLTHPMMEIKEGKFVPNYVNCRYLTEDIPYGLAVIRGIAEVVGVATPNIDKVFTWCQEQMKKEYLVDGKIQGKDVKDTRAPQRYGFTTLKDIIGH